MNNVYNRITQVRIDDTRSYDDWGIYTWRGYTLTQPVEKRTYLSLPAVDGDIDLTESLVGRPVFGNRTLTWTFILTNDVNFEDTREKITEFCHGKRRRIYLPGDERKYLMGRINVGALEYRRQHCRLTLTATCDPFFELSASTSRRIQNSEVIQTPVSQFPAELVGGDIEVTVNRPAQIVIDGRTHQFESAGTRILDRPFASNRPSIEVLNMDFGISANATAIQGLNGTTVEPQYVDLGVMPYVHFVSNNPTQFLAQNIIMSINFKAPPPNDNWGGQRIMSDLNPILGICANRVDNPTWTTEHHNHLLIATDRTDPNAVWTGRAGTQLAPVFNSSHLWQLAPSPHVISNPNNVSINHTNIGNWNDLATGTWRFRVARRDFWPTGRWMLFAMLPGHRYDNSQVASGARVNEPHAGRFIAGRGTIYSFTLQSFTTDTSVPPENRNVARSLVPARAGDRRFSVIPLMQNGFWCTATQRFFGNANPNSGQLGLDFRGDLDITIKVVRRSK